MKVQFAQKITGERKAVIAVIAGVTCSQVTYTRAPRFAYEADGWSIDREGVLTSPAFPIREAALHANIIRAMEEHDFAAEGALTVMVIPDEFISSQLQNVNAILAGKTSLLQHAFQMEGPLSAYTFENGFAFPIFHAYISSPAILAAIQFSMLVVSQAGSQVQVRTKDRPVDNEKYAMRCFLLRIGMIGPEYAVARKALLANLRGDGSFKSGERVKRNERIPAIPLATDSVENMQERTEV